MKTIFVKKSGNAKTGPIPVTYSQRETCPPSCPHYREDCYAEDYYTRMAWDKVPRTGIDWADLCRKIEKLPAGQLWRHNVAGDLPGQGENVDPIALGQLIAANKGKKGFTYSHKKNAQAIEAIRAANRDGFTVNLSADDAGEADNLAALGAGPIVAIVPMDTAEKTLTPAGRVIIVCPAQSRDNVTCETCGLCSIASRDVIIGFRAHGTRAKLADSKARRVIPIVKS